MWSFYYRHSKQEAVRNENELFGQSISKSQNTLKSLWVQSLLLLLFCLDCSCAPIDSLTDSLSHAGSLHVKSNFPVLNITHPPEMQHSVPQILFWKPEALKRGPRALRVHPITSVSSHKLYKHRLFRRNLEKLSQKNSTSLLELASTLTEIFRKMVNDEALYFWPDLENANSISGSSNKRSLPDFPVEFLRTGPLNDTTLDHLLKVPDSATILHLNLSEELTSPLTRGPLSEELTSPLTRGPLSEELTSPLTRGPLSEELTPPSKLNVVSQMHDFSDDTTSSAVGQMQSMLTHIMFDEPEDGSSPGSINKQEQASDFKFLVQSENTLPFKLHFPYRNGEPIDELNYTDILGSRVTVTDGGEILTETSAPQSGPFTLKTSSSYANNELEILPISSLKNVEQYSAIDRLVTDQFNLFDTSTHPKYETSTFGYLIPSMETSVSFEHDVAVTGISQTNSNLESSAVSVNTELYSQNSKPSLSDLHFELSDVYASFYLREDNWDLEFVTPQTVAVTDGTEILTETSAPQSGPFTLKTSSSYENNKLERLPISFLNNVEQYSAIDKLVTDQFNLFDTSTHPKYETTTFGYLIPVMETSTISFQLDDVAVTGISLTNSTLESSPVSVNTKLYSQNSKPSLSDLHFDLSDIYASFYLREDDNWDLEFVTPQTMDDGDLTSASPDPDTDISHMTLQRKENSSVVNGTLVGIFSASSNLTGHVELDSFSAQTTPHTSKADQTSDHESLDQQRDTRTFSTSTLLPQTMITEKMSHSISWQPVNTDFNTFSSVTPSPYQVKDKACVLQIHDPANTEAPKSSEPFRLSSIYKLNKNESNATELSASTSVTPNHGSISVETTSTDAYSELAFQRTMTPFEYDVFNDVMNGNDQQFSSTVQPVQTSQSTLNSTEAHNVSKSANASGGQVHTSHKLSNVSLPVGTRSLFDPTIMPTTLQWNISIKSLADMEAASVKTSTYIPSTQNLVSKILHPRIFQMTSNSTRSPLTVTATITSHYPDQNIVTSTLPGMHLKTQTASNTTRKPLITSKWTSLSQSSKITNTLSTSIVTPAAKVWIPQTISPVKPITTPINYSTGQVISSAPTSTEAVVTMPLNFNLVGVSFSEQLLNHTSEEYRELQKEIKLVMDKIFFAKYQSDYLETEIKAFLKGSVVVRSDIVFQSNSDVPSESHLIRTVLTDGTKTNYFGWSINGSTVELNGYTKSNLELEVLSISFLVLHVGYIAVSQKNQEKQGFLDNLQKEVFYAVNTTFPITKVSLLEIRDVYGDLKVRGNLYLNATVHTNEQALMSSLLSLVNRNVDLSSIIVNDISIELKVHSINFRVTNRKFGLSLLDMASSESQLLSKDLSTVVQSVLQDFKPIQVVMREFKSGSVVCRGDLVYRHPAPSSKEILRHFLKTLGSDGLLASSTYQVDFKSITIGDSSPGLPNEYVDFPGFGVAIIVMCGLCLIIFPIILFVCSKTSMLGHRQKATIQRRNDPVGQSHHFEMDNQAFRASIEQP